MRREGEQFLKEEGRAGPCDTHLTELGICPPTETARQGAAFRSWLEQIADSSGSLGFSPCFREGLVHPRAVRSFVSVCSSLDRLRRT